MGISTIFNFIQWNKFNVNFFLKLLFIAFISPNILFSQQSDNEEKNRLAVFPGISFSPETSLQFGVASVMVLNQSSDRSSTYYRESTFSPFFLYTLKRQIITAIRANYFTKSGDLLEIDFRYLNFPDLYFGIGNSNDPDQSEFYSNVVFSGRGSILKKYKQKYFLGLSWEVQYNKLEDIIEEGLMETDKVNGISGGLLTGVGPMFRFDSRNHTIYPSRGNWFTFRSLFYFIGNYGYTDFLIDARKYLQLGNENNILAFQLVSQFLVGNDIPFYKLPQLGGRTQLRGISNASLYRDKNLMYVQAEYRRPLFWRFGMTLFAGLGNVSPNLSNFSTSSIKHVVGLGGRFSAIPSKKLNLRLDVGLANGGQMAFYAGISEAF